MPRVVPSQVITLIDRWFPIVADRERAQRGFTLTRDNRCAGTLNAIVNLVERIPDELLTLDMREYGALVAAVAEIRYAIGQWQERDYMLRGMREFDGLDPVSLIRRALSVCPDEFPSSRTAALNFITDQDLRENLRIDISAMDRALSNGEWKAATVLAGSVIEALLLWALQQHPPSDISATVSQLVGNSTLDRNPGGRLESWRLPVYIEVAAVLNIINPDTASQARLAKDFRNLIHPGRAQRLGQMCDRATALSTVAAVEHVVRCL